jgi:hypothetical protein
VYRLSSFAEILIISDRDFKDKVHYEASVTVVGYNDTYSMMFQIEDPKSRQKRDLDLGPELCDAISARPGVPQELLDDVAKARDAAIARQIAGLGSKEFAAREAAGETLKRWGKAALPALKKALDDKDRAEAAKKIIEAIGG